MSRLFREAFCDNRIPTKSGNYITNIELYHYDVQYDEWTYPDDSLVRPDENPDCWMEPIEVPNEEEDKILKAIRLFRI